jgi:hypothetical protein
MSLLGFDSIGRRPLGALPDNGNFALVAIKGALALTGRALTFQTAEIGSFGSFAFVGTANSFKIGSAQSAGAFASVGSAAAFGIAGGITTSVSALTGIAATNLIVERAATAGPISLGGVSTFFSIAGSSGSMSYQLAGFGSTYARGFEAWVPRLFDVEQWSATAAQVDSWSLQTSASQTWTATSEPAGAWTPVPRQPELWTEE